MFKPITASEIEAWTDREPHQVQRLLPKLIMKLILSSNNEIINCNFPSGKGIQYAGYDGYLNCSKQTNFFPKGESVWEIGTNKNIQEKFNQEIKKRTENPLQVNKQDTVFVFVTPRIWCHKKGIQEIITENKKNSEWKDIKIIDANFLELWLEASPSVSIWLAIKMGQDYGNCISIEDYWTDKTSTTNPKLNQDFFLEGRKEIVDSIINWFKSDCRKLMLKADTVMEALLVLSAVILSGDDIEHERMNNNCLIVEDEESWSKVISLKNKNMVLILNFNITNKLRYPNDCRYIILKNKYFSETRNNEHCQLIDIPKLNKGEYRLSMKKLGFESEQINQYEIKTKRSFPALYRQITTIPSRQIPEWADSLDLSELLPALFVGRWDNNFEGDKQVIEILSGSSYVEYEKSLVNWITIEDSPIMKIGDEYMLVSVSDAWYILWDKITSSAYKMLCKCILEVFSVKEPRYELPEEKWVFANLSGKDHRYSRNLLEGLVITMIMLSENDGMENYFGSISTKKDMDDTIYKLLSNITDWQDWYTVAPYLPLLVEAAPDSVLLELESKASSSDEEFWRLFYKPKNVWINRPPYVGLLWALEKLAWETRYAGRVIDVLVKFEEKCYNYEMTDRPMDLLLKIFCLWSPQTCLSLKDRELILGSIVKKSPNIGWQLIKKLLLNKLKIASNTSKHRWRDASIKTKKFATSSEFKEAINVLFNICLQHVSSNAEQWDVIFSGIDVFAHKLDKISELFIEQCKEFSQEEKMSLCCVIRQTIHRHRKDQKNNWSMTEEKILQLENLYQEILPKCPAQYYYLFKYRPYVLDPVINDSNDGCFFEIRKKKIYELRHKAVVDTENLYGMNGVFKIVENAEDISDLATIIVSEFLNYNIDWKYIFELKDRNTDVAESVIYALYRENGFVHIKDSVDGLHDHQIGFIMCCLPCEREVVEYIKSTSALVKAFYWENLMICNLENENALLNDYIIDELLKKGRLAMLMTAIARSDYENSNNIIRILDKGLEIWPNERETAIMQNPDLPNVICELFEKLYGDEAAKEKKIAELEFSYLPITSECNCLKYMTSQLLKRPDLYFQLIRVVYKKGNYDVKELSKEEKIMAQRAIKVLERFTIIPGYDSNKEIIDENWFNNWFEQILTLSAKSNYVSECETYIGKLLSYSPKGNDGIWPHEYVREFLEKNWTELMAKCFYFGRINQRSVYMSTNGKTEEKLGLQYEEYASAIEIRYPKVASVVRKISVWYLNDAKSECISEMKNFD